MLFSEVTVVKRHEYHPRRHNVTHFRRSDNGSTARDDPDTIAIQDAEPRGVGLIDSHEDTGRRLVELRCLCRFGARMPVVRLPTADGNRRKLFIRRLERRLVFSRHEYGPTPWIAFVTVLVECVLVSGLEIGLVGLGALPFSRKIPIGVQPSGAFWMIVVSRPLNPAAFGKLLVGHP